MFEKLESLTIRFYIDTIELLVFKELVYLRKLSISIYFMRNFLKKGTSWMQYLNYNTKFFYNETSIIDSSKQLIVKFNILSDPLYENMYEDDYNFPNEDFCLFKNFPHKNYFRIISISFVKIQHLKSAISTDWHKYAIIHL